jgi:hypothetical protein
MPDNPSVPFFQVPDNSESLSVVAERIQNFMYVVKRTNSDSQ